MKSRGCIYISLFIVLVILFMQQSIVAAQGPEASSILLKVSLREGDSVDKSISVSSDEGGLFTLSVENVLGIVLSEYDFVLEPFEEEQVVVQFSTEDLATGVYVGHIRIENLGEVSVIPVIFEVESEDVFFDVNLDIPPQFTQLEPGESLIAQVQIFDLTEGLGPITVEMEYFLYNIDGNILSSESESVVIDGQTSFTKTQTLPFEIEFGDYVYSTVARFGSSAGASSAIFSVTEPESLPTFFVSNFIFIFFIAALLIMFLVGIGFFSYIIHDRSKLVVELRRHNAVELKKQRELLFSQFKFFKGRKPKHIREIEKQAKQKISKLRAKQSQRLDEFRKLKKKGNVREMKRKLAKVKEEARMSFDAELKTRLEQERKQLADTKKIKFIDVSGEVRRLEYQKSILEKAYSEGYIKRKSHDEGKKKIDMLITKLKKRL